jgi:mannose-1-phosphate guanylyltransferase
MTHTPSTAAIPQPSNASDVPDNRYGLIIAGGNGERFWPQSRIDCPKYLLPIVGSRPMLTQTLERLRALLPVERIFIITSQRHASKIKALCPEVPEAQIIAEPYLKDTATAIGVGMTVIQQQFPEAVCAVLPADHVIHDTEAYEALLKTAWSAAAIEGVLLTIGIKPTYPATGYGYMCKSFLLKKVEQKPLFQVSQFTEKPDLETARTYIESGNYYWNSGIFVWSVGILLKALEIHTPILHQELLKIRLGLEQGDALSDLLEMAYSNLEAKSIDYAVLEKASNVVMLEATFDWDDVGEWQSICRHSILDESGNYVTGKALIEQSINNIIVSSPNHLTVLFGINDLIVVTTADATLVCPRSFSQDIKKIINQLKCNPEYARYL